MKFRFSWRISFIGTVLILSMLRLSYWQWERHCEKVSYIKSMESRLNEPVIPILSLLNKNLSPKDLEYKRVSISGTYDFDKEFILRNRKYKDSPGAFIITPLKINGDESSILVSRGFIPLSLSDKPKRLQFRKEASTTFIGLIKNGSQPRLLAPKDPPSGTGFAWVDAWLRVNIEEIQKQIPYKLLPFYVEIMNTTDQQEAKERIVTSDSNRDEIFLLTKRDIAVPPKAGEDLSAYPIPVFDTVVPPGRHFGYIFEWAIMALVTFIICLILQMRRPQRS